MRACKPENASRGGAPRRNAHKNTQGQVTPAIVERGNAPASEAIEDVEVSERREEDQTEDSETDNDEEVADNEF
jgi:hypothetical protein